MPTILALCGLKGSGKTTLRQTLIRTQSNWTGLSFADPLRQMLRAMLKIQGLNSSVIDRMLLGDLKETPSPLLGNRTPRHALQTLGTEWGRELISPTIWTDIWQERITGPLAQSNSVTDDLRFHNEAEVVKSLNGLIVRIERPGVELDPRHVSELEQLQIAPDFAIINDGAPSDMLYALNTFIGKHNEPRKN